MTQVDVFAPIELQDPVFGPVIVGIDDRARGLIPTGRCQVEDDADRKKSKKGADHDKKNGHKLLSERLQTRSWNRIDVELQAVVVPERLGKEHVRHTPHIHFPDEAEARERKLR